MADKILIADDFIDWRFHPGAVELPYAYSGAILRDELKQRLPEVEVVWSQSEQETLRHLPDADIVLSDIMKRDHFERAQVLSWVHMRGSGPDHYFKLSEVGADDFRRRGIAITVSAGAVSVVVAEQIVCYMTMFSRDMLRALRQQRSRLWQRYSGLELCGMTLGIIGLGAIGARTALLAKAMGMIVIGAEPNPSEAARVADEILPADAYPEIFRRGDFVLVSCPITGDTRRIVNRDTLAMMKPTAYLINVGRGECIDEPAVVGALKSGALAGYASDNFGDASGELTADNLEILSPQSELWGLDNVIITPNCAEAAPKRYVYMAANIADNYGRWKNGREFVNRLVWEGEVV
jgi:phosphoglycerate dehydrogenase-like enzyme